MPHHVWIVVVTHNSERRIDRCLAAVKDSTVPARVLVVDNASQDATLTILASRHSDVAVIRRSVDSGFGQACNVGMTYALQRNAEYIALVTDRAILMPDTVERLIDALVCKDLGIVVPTPVNNDDTIDGTFLKLLAKYCSNAIFGAAILGRLAQVYEINTIPAAVLLCNAKALPQIGGFDPLFFMPGAEIDYIYRASISEWKAGYVPRALINHESSRNERGAHTSIASWIEDDYAWCLFQLKKVDRALARQIVHVCGTCIRALLSSLNREYYRRALGAPIVLMRLVVILPKVWRHRKRCRSGEAPFLEVSTMECRLPNS